MKMVKWGEIGGILEEAYAQLADLLEDVIRTWSLTGRTMQWLQVLMPGQQQVHEDWHDLDWQQRRFLLMVMCRSLGQMLGAGVPLLTAADTAADFLPVRQRDDFTRTFADHIRSGGRIRDYLISSEMMPAFLIKMVSVGEETGNLDILLQKVALAYQKQLELEAM